MNILVINCGSSSLKYQLIDSESEKVLAKGLCERIGIDNSAITHQPDGGEKRTEQIDMPDHTVAVKLVIEKLTDKEAGVIGSLDEIGAVGHRIVHDTLAPFPKWQTMIFSSFLSFPNSSAALFDTKSWLVPWNP